VALPDGTLWLRGYGLTFQCNVLGGLVVVGLILSLSLWEHLWPRLLAGLCLAALVSSLSRSAWLAALCTVPPALALLCAKVPRLRAALPRIAAGAVIVLAVSGVLLAKPIAARLAPVGATLQNPAATLREPSRSPESERIELMRLALQTAAGKPLTGVGAGAFSLHLMRQDADTTFHPVHNVPLLLAAEIGIVGGVVWITGGIVALGLLLSRWNVMSARAIAALAAWLAICIISVFDHYWWGILTGRTMTVIVLAMVDRALTERTSQTFKPPVSHAIPG
jgi:hypothetical protein